MQNTRERLLASSMICGVAFLGLSANQAFAAAADAAGGDVSEIVVTGTRIPSPNLTSIAPITTVGNADIKAQGVTRIEDLTNSLPQVFAGQGSSINNAANGTATVNLRNLGAARTLVLIDGRRAQPTPADLNFIPSALVERVDVLTGGASATYGADAVAGVVNFVMLKNFEGVRLDAEYNGYQHDNNNATGQNALLAAQKTGIIPSEFAVPQKSLFEGEGSQVTIILGANAPDGKGNITAYATYRQNNPILQADRDFSACTFASTAAGFTCSGSGTSFPARVGNFTVDPTTFNTLRPRNANNDVFNFGPTNFFVRPDERYSLGAFAHYEIAPWAEAYMDTMFLDDTSTEQIASGGIFAGTHTVNCANPFLSAQEAGVLPAVGGGTCATNPAGNFTGIVARRLLASEGTGRLQTFRHDDYRIVLGLRGDLGKNWNYDGYMLFNSVQANNRQSGNFNLARENQSLNAVAGPGGTVICNPAANPDPGCVPINIFSSQAISSAAANFLQAPSFSNINTQERVVSLAFTGKLGDYGIKSAWANDGVGVAFGAEYRREHLDSSSDFLSTNGLVDGNGAANPPVSGSFDVYELFGEARVPLISDMPFAKDVSLELGYRFSDYSSVGNTNTYKVAGEWEVIDGLRVRGGYNRAVRAPNINELFNPQNVVLDGNQDPCAGLTANNPLVAQCANVFHLTTQQVLNIEKNPANQYNGLTGGNPNLKPELSDTYTGGVVWQPKFVPGLNMSVDYFNIRVEQFIAGLGENLILNQCVNTANPTFCNLVHRDANGSLFLSNQGFVQDTSLNTGSLKTTGVDLSIDYHTDLAAIGLGDNGSVSAKLIGTWLDTLVTQPLPGGASHDCKGLYGLTCGEPSPAWRHTSRVTWSTPYSYGDWIKQLSFSAQWRYFAKVTLDAFDPNPQLVNPGNAFAIEQTLPSQSYIDLTANFTVHNNLNFRVGVNNVFDKDPPLVGTNCAAGVCSGNTFPQVYDALGRFVFVGLSADF
ncbi:TonB-dependent receptor domain-containing protein [Phenylobacterium sp.]|jgi:outer membrane receptor protein involved in Fe transport|uniref:TonB-dependent receptor domain-containing protein n=1 Tax=Phenylobacterium sp. TaxID=1871053 RepID=UPI002E358904|nr:TonB-dependent receptor [Phenylobacterium sp.]HEX3363662.1 TonB-dependent receptor [Phenylobacterium sp.]